MKNKILFLVFALSICMLSVGVFADITISPTSWNVGEIAPGRFETTALTISNTASSPIDVNVSASGLPPYIYFTKTHFLISGSSSQVITSVIAPPTTATLGDYSGTFNFNSKTIPVSFTIGGSSVGDKKIYSKDRGIGQGFEASWQYEGQHFSMQVFLKEIDKDKNKIKIEVKSSGIDNEEWLDEGSTTEVVLDQQGTNCKIKVSPAYIVSDTVAELVGYIPASSVSVSVQDRGGEDGTSGDGSSTTCDISIKLLETASGAILKVTDKKGSGLNGDADLTGVETSLDIPVKIVDGYGTVDLPPGETILAGSITIPSMECKIPWDYTLKQSAKGPAVLNISSSNTQPKVGDTTTLTVTAYSGGVADVKVYVAGPEATTLLTNTAGQTTFTFGKEGTYVFHAIKDGYDDSDEISIEVTKDEEETNTTTKKNIFITFYEGGNSTISVTPGTTVTVNTRDTNDIVPLNVTATVKYNQVTESLQVNNGVATIALNEETMYTFSVPETEHTNEVTTSISVGYSTSPATGRGAWDLGTVGWIAIVILLLIGGLYYVGKYKGHESRRVGYAGMEEEKQQAVEVVDEE